jgi:O-antigen/teichoic acid export membrane protein
MNKKLKVSEFGQVLIRFGSAQMVSNFLRMLSGFLVVHSLEPELYGQFTGIGVYLGYILLGHGGIINGLSRELPYELGRKNDVYAKELASSVFFLSIIISLLAALIFLGFSIKHFFLENYLTGLIYLAYVFIGGLQLLNNQFLPTLYLTNNAFDSLSRQNILSSLGNLITVLFVWFFGIYGLIVRGIVLVIYEFFLLLKNKPYVLTLNYDFKHYKKLFKTGLPIFLVGQVNPIWTTIMNNFIFSVGGALNFGLFSLSIIVQGAVGIIPAAFSQIIYPRMTIMLGEGKPLSQILKANIKPLFFQFSLMSIISIIGFFSLPYIIPMILPKYVDGIEAAQWMFFIPVVQSFGALNNIYNVVKKQMWYFISLVTGAVAGSIFVFLQVNQKGFSLEVFPQGLLLGNIIQQLLSLAFIKLLLRDEFN